MYNGDFFQSSLSVRLLVFFDWQKGHVLQLTVISEILWNDKEQPNSTTKRTLRFTPTKIDFIKNGLAYLDASLI